MYIYIYFYIYLSRYKKSDLSVCWALSSGASKKMCLERFLVRAEVVEA